MAQEINKMYISETGTLQYAIDSHHHQQLVQQFPLTSVESFRIPLRRKNIPTTPTMYEQSLDLDTFHSYLNQHNDPNESRFYDDFFNLATSQDWKTTKRLPGLPTPPSTPDKTRFQFESPHMPPNFPHHNSTHHNMQQHQQKIHSNHSPASGLQVVPDSIEDHQQNEYLPWFQDNNKYFNDQQKQQHHIQQQHIHSQNDITTSMASSPIDRNQSPHIPVARNGPPYPGYELSDVRCNTTHLNLAAIPDCILSPVSPRKRSYPFNNNNNYNNNNNNNYANNNNNNYVNNNNYANTTSNNYVNPTSNNYVNPSMMPSPNHVMSPMPSHFSNNDIVINNQSMRTSEENYYRQLAYEKLRSQHKLEEIESPTLEQELSLATHNVLERQRRNDLKLRFNILRDNIPELANNDKAPKIQILKKALEHLAELKSQEQKYLVDVELEKQRKIILVNRLKSLQSAF